MSAVRAAIEKNDVAELKVLLARGSSSNGSLHMACSLGHDECLKMLLVGTAEARADNVGTLLVALCAVSMPLADYKSLALAWAGTAISHGLHTVGDLMSAAAVQSAPWAEFAKAEALVALGFPVVGVETLITVLRSKLRGKAIDWPDPGGNSPLHLACNQGQDGCVQLLLAAHAAIDQLDSDRDAPLYLACNEGNSGCVQLLLAAHAAVDQPGGNGSTPLDIACNQGHGECVQVLLTAHAAVDQPGGNGQTPLHSACNEGYPECVQLLFTAHADVKKRDSEGNMPLHRACSRGHGECVKLLLAANAAIDATNLSANSGRYDTKSTNNNTPLFLACREGYSNCAQLLLAANADVDLPDIYGNTPLNAACNVGHGECVQLLLVAHAAIDQPNNFEGVTPLHIACNNGWEDCVNLLLDAHAAVDPPDHTNNTPLYLACLKGNGNSVCLLLAAKAAVDAPGENGVTPLHAACLDGNDGCVRLLLFARAATDQTDINGLTPLHATCGGGYLDIVKQLVQAGARTDLRASNGLTVLRMAEDLSHTAIAKYLRTNRRAPALAAAASMSAKERAAAERAAELAATALLAELEAESAGKQQAQKKKASKKSKAKQGGGAGSDEQPQPSAAGSSATSDCVKAAANTEAAVEAVPATVAAADEALRGAMASAQYEVLVRALEQHCAQASEGVLAEARALRERLHKKHKKNSQKLRRAHAVEMEALAGISSLSLTGASPQLPQAAAATTTPAASTPPPAAAPLPAAAVALMLAELTAATGDFGEQKLIGSGGYGHVFSADALPSLPPEALPPRVRHLPVAVKRAKSGAHNLVDLQREVSVLQQCSHPHLLPLLGYCLELGSPCLVFPLMRGGSFADRLWPSKADPEHLRRLGLSAPLRPLQWRERLGVLRQTTEALLYLHTSVPGGGKGAVVHRDFKPENILLDDDGNAFLADTGFAKMESAGPEVSKMKSASNALYLTLGYLDPSISAGGEYSAATDGWALGITILVALTSRSPLKVFEDCEDEFNDDFDAIDAVELAGAEVDWPPHVATAIKDLVRSAQSGLCHTSNRRRMAVADALVALTRLAGEGESSGSSAVESPAVLSNGGARSKAPPSPDQPYEPTPLSMQVRETRKGGGAQKRIQDNMLLAFGNLMPRLDAIYATSAAVAPEGFEERINFWHIACGMPSELRGRLHLLRVWANAARHHDAERWRRDGPRSEAAASQLLAAVETALGVLPMLKR